MKYVAAVMNIYLHENITINQPIIRLFSIYTDNSISISDNYTSFKWLSDHRRNNVTGEM